MHISVLVTDYVRKDGIEGTDIRVVVSVLIVAGDPSDYELWIEVYSPGAPVAIQDELDIGRRIDLLNLRRGAEVIVVEVVGLEAVHVCSRPIVVLEGDRDVVLKGSYKILEIRIVG